MIKLFLKLYYILIIIIVVIITFLMYYKTYRDANYQNYFPVNRIIQQYSIKNNSKMFPDSITFKKDNIIPNSEIKLNNLYKEIYWYIDFMVLFSILITIIFNAFVIYRKIHLFLNILFSVILEIGILYLYYHYLREI